MGGGGWPVLLGKSAYMGLNLNISQRHYYGVMLLLAAITILYIPSIVRIVNFWIHSPSYSHSILLVPICIYLIYQRIVDYKFKIKVTPTYIVLIFSSVILWFVAVLGSIQFIEFIALIAIYISVLFYCFGGRQVRALSILLIMLVFTLPVWEYLSVAIRTLTTPIVGLLLTISGISFKLDGFLVILKEGVFIIEESCSGLHQITAAVPLLIIYAHKRIEKFHHWILLGSGAVLTAFVANTIRIYVVIIIGDMTNMQHSLVKEHGLVGWIIFGILFALYIFWLEKFIIKKIEVSAPSSRLVSGNFEQVKNGPRYLIFVIMVLLVGPVLYGIYNYKNYSTSVSVDRIETAMPWKSANIIPAFKPHYPDGDLVINKVFENIKGKKVNLFLSLYLNEKQGVEAVNNLNKIYDEEQWQLVSKNEIRADLDGIKFVALENVIGSRKNEYYMVWYGYIVNNKYMVDDKAVKFTGLYQKLKFNPGVVFFTISRRIEVNYASSRQQVELFAGENMPYIFREFHRQ